MTKIKSASVWFLIVCCVAAVAGHPSLGDELATISGRITDPHGLVVAGVKVDATNVNTNITYSGETNADGLYRIPSIPPGLYRVTVQKTGFAQILKPDVELHVQDLITLNFSMQLGSVNETVTVEGGAPLVNTENAAVGTVIDHNFAENLPLNGRSFNTLLQLTPGVVIAPTNSANQGQFSIAGQRTSSNNFVVDGVSANFGVSFLAGLGTSGTGSAQAFSANGGTSSLVSVEALQEFRIETSSFAPEFGRAPGGQVILTTRAGTNALHGGVYDYFRNDVMDANDWFNNAAHLPRSPERHNDFGGTLGGPIWKDRTFFFASYEGARLRQPVTQVAAVPYITVSPCLPSPAIAPFLTPYPKPNGPVSTATCTGQFTGSASNPFTLDAGSIRIDHTFNSRFSVFGRYNEAPSMFSLRFGGNSVQPTEVNTRTATLGATMTLGPQMANAFRANYSLQRASSVEIMDSFGGAALPDLSVLAPSLPNLGNTLVLFGTFDTSTLAVGPIAHNRSAQWNFVDDLSLTQGTHQLKFGGDYRAIYTDAIPQQAGLAYLISSVSALLTTTPSADFGIVGTASKSSYFLTRAFSLYGQDTWKATPRLALTYGLRWEVNPAPSGRQGTALPAWSNVNNPSQLTLAPLGTEPWSTTYTNFAPRVGIAYSLTRKGDLVLRAGWGMFYDLASDSAGSLGGDFPNGTGAFLFPGNPPPAPPCCSLPLADGRPYIPAISSQPPYPFMTNGFDPNLKLPRSYQWNVALERSFGRQQTVSVTYVGQAGRDFLRQEGINPPNLNFPLPDAFFLTRNDAFSNYDALQVQYRRPLSRGLQALLNYAWSHSLDNASNDAVSFVSRAVISAANDYASSDFDVRHSFSGALTYAIPAAARNGVAERLTGGWSLDTVIVARSGFPFNGLLNTTIQGSPQRPDLAVPLRPFWIPNAAAGGGKSLNPAAFVAPPPNRQGTEGRNDIPGFGLTQVDLSLARKFTITERLNLQFRTDAFNIFNHPNFANPQGVIGSQPIFLESQHMLNNGLSQGGGLNPLFQEGGPRSLQLSLKLSF